MQVIVESQQWVVLFPQFKNSLSVVIAGPSSINDILY